MQNAAIDRGSNLPTLLEIWFATEMVMIYIYIYIYIDIHMA